jgi:YjjG family noncanonical pyrimidine nucleotidase
VEAITHIFFDLDHTLWDFDTNSELAFDKIFRKDHPTIETRIFLEKYIPINQACWQLYEVDKISHQELRYNRLRQSFDAIDYVIDDEQIERIAVEYLNFLPEFNHLFEDALETLEYLKTGYKLHIITNGFAATQFRKIHNSKLTDYFETITNSETAGAKKPNPVIFEHALKVAGAVKENSIMIGDSLSADVKGALDFGMRAIFFNPNRMPVDGSIVQIANLAALKTIF